MNNIAISVKGLEKSYYTYKNPSKKLVEILINKKMGVENKVLKKINFDVEKGKTVAIIGTNGAGKSTLLQCIAGTQHYDRGTIELHGRVTALLELGAGFNSELTGIENIYISASVLGLTQQQVENVVQDIIDFADLGDYIYQPVSSYSSGMYVRLAFAIASHTYPDIFIIDEALSVGDVFFQQKCNLFLKNELKDVTKLIVSHDLSYISRMSDSVILLHDGEVYFSGDSLNAIEHYLRLNQSDNRVLNNNTQAHRELTEKRDQPLHPATQVDKSLLSGKLDAWFSEVDVLIRGQTSIRTALVGDRVEIIAKVYVEKEIREPIIGYFLNDKFGTTICGETNREYELTLEKMEAGKYYQIGLVFCWPHIRDDDYFLNIGIGDGHEPFNHVIQCWYMNFVKISGITKEGSTHGLFNNKIEEFYCHEY